MGSFDDPKYSQFAYTEQDIPVLSFLGGNSEKESNTDRYVNYENNTYIDWNQEIHRSQRLNGSGIYKKWAALVILALVLGYVTAFIDLASVWLNDIKKGLCLGKVDDWSLASPFLTCPLSNWNNWSAILFDKKGFISNVVVNFPIYLLFAGCLATTAAYITVGKDQTIKLSGIAETKLIVGGLNYNIASYLGIRTLLFKIAGLVMVVSSGLWLGKEGPLVHVACCVFNITYSLLESQRNQNEAVRRELLSAATATGISVAFNAPIGGVLFVLESLPSFFMPTKIMWNSFISATIAVIVLTGFKIFTEGDNFHEQDLFSVEFGGFSWFFMELIPFLILGIIGGIYGFVFIKLNSHFSTRQFRKEIQKILCATLRLKSDYGDYVEILAVLLITTLLNFPIEITRLPLDAYLKILFTDCPDTSKGEENSNSSNFMCLPSPLSIILKLGYIIIQGFLLCVYTYGLNVPGGVLMPSLVLGASTGRLIGIVSRALQNHLFPETLENCTRNSCLVSPSSYAVIGAASFMTGITKLTMCVVVIVFELTGALTYVLPIMVGVMTLKFVNDWLCTDNIYDTWLKEKFNLSQEDYEKTNGGKGTGFCNFTSISARLKSNLPDTMVSAVMLPVNKTKCLHLTPSQPYTFQALYSWLNNDNNEGYPLTISETDHTCLGYLNKQYLWSKLENLERTSEQDTLFIKIGNSSGSILSKQLYYEHSYSQQQYLHHLEIVPEKSLNIVNGFTPLLVVIEMFEKLHLNYLIIIDHQSNHNTMCGFIDRFMVSRMIDLGFQSIIDCPTTFGPENVNLASDRLDQTDPLYPVNIKDRTSVELIT